MPQRQIIRSLLCLNARGRSLRRLCLREPGGRGALGAVLPCAVQFAVLLLCFSHRGFYFIPNLGASRCSACASPRVIAVSDTQARLNAAQHRDAESFQREHPRSGAEPPASHPSKRCRAVTEPVSAAAPALARGLPLSFSVKIHLFCFPSAVCSMVSIL